MKRLGFHPTRVLAIYREHEVGRRGTGASGMSSLPSSWLLLPPLPSLLGSRTHRGNRAASGSNEPSAPEVPIIVQAAEGEEQDSGPVPSSLAAMLLSKHRSYKPRSCFNILFNLGFMLWL